MVRTRTIVAAVAAAHLGWDPEMQLFQQLLRIWITLQQISEMGTLNLGRREFLSGYRHLNKRTLAQVIQLACPGLRVDQGTGEFNWVSGAPERALGGKCVTGTVFRSCLKR